MNLIYDEVVHPIVTCYRLSVPFEVMRDQLNFNDILDIKCQWIFMEIPRPNGLFVDVIGYVR